MGKFFALYIIIALGTSFYQEKYGPDAGQSYAFNLGRSLMWPALLIEAL
jgi:hypothetical protein